MTRRIHWTSALSAVPLDEPDPRERVVIRDRVVLMPKVWRRCDSGVTYTPPPTMREHRPARPRTGQIEREVLAAIKAGLARRDVAVGRKALNHALFGHPNVAEHYAIRVTEALEALLAAGAITVTYTRMGPGYRAASAPAPESARDSARVAA